ncbi:MAG: Flp pilus assembly protein CpaB [Alphaproteobacteria bacterium]
MRPRVLIVALLAVATAGGAALIARNWLDSQRAALASAQPRQGVAAAPVQKQVLVARQTIQLGRFLKAEDLRWQSWPTDGIVDRHIVKDQRPMEDVIGSVARSRIVAGEPITDERVVKPGERGFLAAVLAPGTRAISVGVNATSGIAGFIFPDDRVDVMVAVEMEIGNGDQRIKRFATETVLHDIRVLAIDQASDDRNGKPVLGKTATLEVTPKQAEIIAVAAEYGKVVLALRGLAQQDAQSEGGQATLVERRSHTWDLDVSDVLTRKTGGDEEIGVVRGSTRSSGKSGGGA